VDDDGAGYIIYTATGLGHTMAVERLSEDMLSSAAHPPAPAPTPPAPAPAGYTLVGHGACRDAAGREPGFATDEPGSKAGVTLASCLALCSAPLPDENACAGVSYCDASEPACTGACHLYLTSKAAVHNGTATWSWTDPGGTLPIAEATKGEAWWTCYAQSTADEDAPAADTTDTDSLGHATPPAAYVSVRSGKSLAALEASADHAAFLAAMAGAAAPAAAAAQQAQRVQEHAQRATASNVSSGVFGQTFVEVRGGGGESRQSPWGRPQWPAARCRLVTGVTSVPVSGCRRKRQSTTRKFPSKMWHPANLWWRPGRFGSVRFRSRRRPPSSSARGFTMRCSATAAASAATAPASRCFCGSAHVHCGRTSKVHRRGGSRSKDVHADHPTPI
jgi:hypothetical protein